MEQKNIIVGSPIFHIRNVSSLTLITGIMSFLLLLIYYLTYVTPDPMKDIKELLKGKEDLYVITQNNIKKNDLTSEQLKEYKRIFKKDEIKRFIIKDKNTDALVMKVFSVASGGFGGLVHTLVGTDGEKVLALKVNDAKGETPGLGQRVTERKFQRQFVGKLKEQMPKDRMDWPNNGLDIISGATFSSMAVVNNINQIFKLYYLNTESGVNNE